ncbi:integrase arm-type DNA-binding domain-containing protein [Brevundimonas sp. UBA7534]|uniref:integrase arm-type DNA-binding domain-containing protein n=1 Tax=Brevundimonas sp. UBA7534 TaxID=1946138 RepID=UPI0025C609E7|nr:integrase arm-type DNA-binding domain-containing protein [Brevundimonas sp. UBA7534]
MAPNPRSAKITKRVIGALTPEGARYTVWDTQLKGFGVRVAATDTKTYVVPYRMIGGADRLLQIARHRVVTAEEARERAAAVLAQVASGGDPQLTKFERREELTMAGLCDLYTAEGTALKKASTLQIDKIRIARHIKPRLGRMKITDITRRDIERLMVDVDLGHIRGEATPHTRGGIHAAARRRDRFLSQAELARLGDVLTQMETDGGDPRHLDIIRLLALTGARKNEIARLRWSEIDREQGLLRLADSKTGAKIIRARETRLAVTVYVANFGKENFAWPACLARSEVATCRAARTWRRSFGPSRRASAGSTSSSPTPPSAPTRRWARSRTRSSRP